MQLCFKQNLLQRHPTSRDLLHRSLEATATAAQGGKALKMQPDTAAAAVFSKDGKRKSNGAAAAAAGSSALLVSRTTQRVAKTVVSSLLAKLTKKQSADDDDDDDAGDDDEDEDEKAADGDNDDAAAALAWRGRVGDAAAGADPFDANEPDPAKSGAQQSSLWEIKTLSRLLRMFSCERSLACSRDFIFCYVRAHKRHAQRALLCNSLLLLFQRTTTVRSSRAWPSCLTPATLRRRRSTSTTTWHIATRSCLPPR
jgi:hypothetical protein